MSSSAGGAPVGGHQAVVVRAGGNAEGVAWTELRLGALLQTRTIEEGPCAAPTAVQTSSVYEQRMHLHDAVEHMLTLRTGYCFTQSLAVSIVLFCSA